VVRIFDTLANKNKIENKDLDSYATVADVEEVIAEAEKKVSKSEVVRDIKKDADKVLENDKVLVVTPKTFKSCQYYGANTKWCIAGKVPSFWQDYVYSRFNKFYIVIDKTKNKKYAVQVSADGKKTVWNEEDKVVSFDVVDNLLKK